MFPWLKEDLLPLRPHGLSSLYGLCAFDAFVAMADQIKTGSLGEYCINEPMAIKHPWMSETVN